MRDLFSWPTKSKIQADNPNLLIAKAANESGEVVAYLTAEPVLLVDGFVLNPNSDPIDLQKAGDVIDSALAQRAGVNRMWVVIPDGAPIMENEKFIRVHERKIYQPATNTKRHGCCDLPQSAAFLN
jgi:hypothetical protein